MQASAASSVTPVKATQAFWSSLTFRSVSIVPVRLSRIVQGTPRLKMSVRTISAKRPALHVRGEDIACQHDPVPGPRQAVAQLDVFDGRPGIEARVKAAESEEDVAADESAAGPERVGRPDSLLERPLLVDEMMEQVAILADDPGAAGLASYEPKRAERPRSTSNRASASPSVRG